MKKHKQFLKNLEKMILYSDNQKIVFGQFTFVREENKIRLFYHFPPEQDRMIFAELLINEKVLISYVKEKEFHFDCEWMNIINSIRNKFSELIEIVEYKDDGYVDIFEQYFRDYYLAEHHTLNRYDDNTYTKENISYHLLKFRGHDYMIGTFFEYIKYNLVTQ